MTPLPGNREARTRVRREVEGTRLDAVVASVPATECGRNCLGLFTVADGDYDWVVHEEERLRFVVLKNVGGERVTIAVEAPAADFEGFLFPRSRRS
jgi:hypothetical protein